MDTFLSTAYYLVLEDHNPLYSFEKWGGLHKHPYGKNITSISIYSESLQQVQYRKNKQDDTLPQL